MKILLSSTKCTHKVMVLYALNTDLSTNIYTRLKWYPSTEAVREENDVHLRYFYCDRVET